MCCAGFEGAFFAHHGRLEAIIPFTVNVMTGILAVRASARAPRPQLVASLRYSFPLLCIACSHSTHATEDPMFSSERDKKYCIGPAQKPSKSYVEV